MKILVLYANPKGTDKLKLNQEIKMIQESLEWSKIPALKFDNIGLIKKTDLHTKLMHYKPDIVQFSSHMTEDGELVLEDEKGRISIVPPKAFENVFANARNITCVVLNCCYSKPQAKSIAKHVPFVIGMKTVIADNAARLFSSKFFQCVGSGLSVQHSFDIAKTEIALLQEGYAEIPELICKPGADASRTYLVQQPSIMAKFKIDSRGRPKVDNDELYQIEIYIQNVPSDVASVLYQYMDPYWSLKEQIEECKNARTNFTDNLAEDGDIEIRAALWTPKGGTAISRNLSEALQSHYGNEVSEPIAKAIKAIEDYK